MWINSFAGVVGLGGTCRAGSITEACCGDGSISFHYFPRGEVDKTSSRFARTFSGAEDGSFILSHARVCAVRLAGTTLGSYKALP